jgi:predicted AAA+ superfamily ATPase
MKIERKAIEALITWEKSKSHKPLILQGASQVGKRWLLKEFGKSHFEDVAIFNSDENPELKQSFASTKDVKRIIENLSLVHGKTIRPEATLIVFDEIQECNDALNTLKYFCEDAPEYYIACAGSLLGVAMSRGSSFPVGKVDFMNIYPVSFMEFLSAADNSLYNLNPSPICSSIGCLTSSRCTTFQEACRKLWSNYWRMETSGMYRKYCRTF